MRAKHRLEGSEERRAGFVVGPGPGGSPGRDPFRGELPVVHPELPDPRDLGARQVGAAQVLVGAELLQLRVLGRARRLVPGEVQVGVETDLVLGLSGGAEDIDPVLEWFVGARDCRGRERLGGAMEWCEAHDRARPERIECRLADGEVRFARAAIRWEEPGEPEGSARLVAMTFVERGVALWDETVERVQRDFRCVDRFFRPPDRREFVAERDFLGKPEPTTLPRVTWRRFPLPQGADWRAARARASELAVETAAELAPRGLALDPSPTFELSESGRPVAIRLRLEEPMDEPPIGWRTLPDRPGAQVLLRSVRQVRYEQLAALRRIAGEGAGTPFLRVPPAGSEDRFVGVFVAAKSAR